MKTSRVINSLIYAHLNVYLFKGFFLYLILMIYEQFFQIYQEKKDIFLLMLLFRNVHSLVKEIIDNEEYIEQTIKKLSNDTSSKDINYVRNQISLFYHIFN